MTDPPYAAPCQIITSSVRQRGAASRDASNDRTYARACSEACDVRQLTLPRCLHEYQNSKDCTYNRVYRLQSNSPSGRKYQRNSVCTLSQTSVCHHTAFSHSEELCICVSGMVSILTLSLCSD